MKKAMLFGIVFGLMLMLPRLTFSAPFLVCDPQAIGVDNYKVEITGPATTTLDVEPEPTGTYGFVLDLSPLSLPDGSYSVRVNASNMWGTSDWSTDYPFVKSAAGIPVNLRVVPDLP